jgi:hypothetical protein
MRINIVARSVMHSDQWYTTVWDHRLETCDQAIATATATDDASAMNFPEWSLRPEGSEQARNSLSGRTHGELCRGRFTLADVPHHVLTLWRMLRSESLFSERAVCIRKKV